MAEQQAEPAGAVRSCMTWLPTGIPEEVERSYLKAKMDDRNLVNSQENAHAITAAGRPSSLESVTGTAVKGKKEKRLVL